MLRRFAPFFAPVLFVVFGAAGPFEGCDEESREAPRPLPRDTAGACFFDEDCVPVGCEALRCIAGSCVEVAAIRDADGDGHAPPPCGMDCNDRDVTIAPERPETCDLVDQDCDGNIDENAAPTAIRFDLDTVDPTMTAASWGDRVVVSDAAFTTRGVRTRRLALDGALGTVEPLLDTTRDPIGVSAASTTRGAWFVIALEATEGAEASLALVEIERDDAGAVRVVDAPVMHDVESVVAAVIVTLDDAPYVVWDTSDATRFAWSPAWTDAVQVADGLVAGLGALDAASDGEHLVVPSGRSSLAFLAAADGALLASVATAGELASGRPLGSDDGHVWALVRDAFDHSVQVIRASGGEPATTLPTGGGSTHLGVHRTPDGLVVTRGDLGSVRAWVLDADAPATIRRTFGPSEISGAAARVITNVEIAPTTQGTAIITNFGAGGSSLAVLACGAGS